MRSMQREREQSTYDETQYTTTAYPKILPTQIVEI